MKDDIPEEVKEFSIKLQEAWDKEIKLTLDKRGGEISSQDLQSFGTEVYRNLKHRLRDEDWYTGVML